MKKLFISLMLLSTTVFAAEPAAAPFTPQQEARIREMIRETLVNNPDILEQAVDAWQKDSQAKQGEQLSKIIEQNKKALYQDANSPRMGASLVERLDESCRCSRPNRLALNSAVISTIKPINQGFWNWIPQPSA